MIRVERIVPLKLTAEKAKSYALQAAETELGKRVVKVKNLGGGSFGNAFGLRFDDGSRIVVKLLRAKNMLEKEVFDLALLGKNCPVPMPKVIFSRPADDVIPIDCYGMEKIEGKNAFMAFGMLLWSKKRRKAFADRMTDALHALHEVRNARFGDTLNPDAERWIDCYKPFAEAVLKKAEELYREGRVTRKIIGAMRLAWEKFDVVFSEPVKEACLIHGDLNVANVMVDRRGAITGLIDPLNSMYADREYDLFQFDNLTGKRFYLSKTYLEKYGGSRYVKQKLAFYGLWNEVFCLIKSDVLIGFIMNPLVKNMKRLVKSL